MATQHWHPNIMAPPGREGESPYLGVEEFESTINLLRLDNPSIDDNTLFGSLPEAVDWRSNAARTERNVDPTIPRTQEQKKALVKLLFKAFKSIAIANDNEPMIKPFKEHRHDNKRVEVLCWNILESTIRRAENGPLLYAFDPSKAKYNCNLTGFAERFDGIIEALATSKTICKHLFDAPYLNSFVDDPVNSRKRVHSNRELNKRKGRAMAQGKKILEAQAVKNKPYPVGLGDVPGKLVTEVADTTTSSNVSNTLNNDNFPYSSSMQVFPQPTESMLRSRFGGEKNDYDQHGDTHGLFSSSYAFPSTTLATAPTQSSFLDLYSSGFTPINRMDTQAYGRNYSALTDMIPQSSSTPSIMPHVSTTQLPSLDHAYIFGSDENKTQQGSDDAQQDFSAFSESVPYPTPRKVLPVRSTTSFQVPAESVVRKSSTDSSSGRDPPDDDDADLDYIPNEGSPSKKLHH